MGYVNAFVHVWKEIRKQRRFNRTFLLPYLRELETKYNGRFEPEQRNKIVNYYGLFITSFLCSHYKRLYGEELTPEERKRATLFGILTPVGDDLFDVDKLGYDSIRQITFSPQTVSATTFSSHVAKEIQSYLLKTVPHTEEYRKASADVLKIQEETAAQTNPNISKTDLQRITYTKGAVSVIIYHQCLNTAASPAMLDALWHIGSLYQVGNDLFDLFKDVRDNIFTLVNTCSDFKAFRKEFLEQVQQQNEAIMSLPYPLKRKKEFCIVMNTINARSLVALDGFVTLQKKTGASLNWWQQSRKNMITDMEKPANIFRWLYYIYKLPKLSTAAPRHRV